MQHKKKNLPGHVAAVSFYRGRKAQVINLEREDVYFGRISVSMIVKCQQSV